MYMETLINFYLGQMSQLTSQKIVIHGKIWQPKSKSMLTGPYIKFSATDYVNERTTKMIWFKFVSISQSLVNSLVVELDEA